MPARNRREIGKSLEPTLQAGERLLWSGRPCSDSWFLPQDVLLIPFSLLWGGFAIFWEISALTAHHTTNSGLLDIWGVPFVLVGLYLIAGRFFVRRWSLTNTMYAVTNRRVLSITPTLRGGHKESAIWLRSYPQIEKRGTRHDRGTLLIGSSALGPRMLLADPGWPSGSFSRGGGALVLFDIEQADHVYQLINTELNQDAR